MKLEGSLDAFSLPDILQLLAFTQKTGALVLRREGVQGVVRVRSGAVTNATSDTGRQALARRLASDGSVPDEALAQAVDQVRADPSLGMARALVLSGAVAEGQLADAAAEQARDAVCELLRWTDGAFEFVSDSPDPDAVELALPVDEVVAEGRRRLEEWSTFAGALPGTEAVLALSLSPAADPSCTREEWGLLALVDGQRSVAELVSLSGRGEYAVVRALSGLVERGLVRPLDESDGGLDRVLRRHELLSAVESRPAPVAPARPRAADPTPAAPAAAAQPYDMAVAQALSLTTDGQVPAQAAPPEPIAPSYAAAASHDQAFSGGSAYAGGSGMGASVVGAVEGSAAMAAQPMPAPVPLAPGEADTAVTKSLLLRLIAGVRGL